MPSIVVVCGDPGGANAVAPVIELLRTENFLSVHALAYRQAHTLWAERGLEHEEIPNSATQEYIVRQLRQCNANLVLTGTSVNSLEFEKQFIASARVLHIPSISVLDFWSNYALRFCDEAGSLSYLPDQIAVMDSLARDEMMAAGITGSSITITGHPALDGLEAYRHGFTHEQRDAVRQNLGIALDEWLVVYASQPPTFSEQDNAIPPPWLDRIRTVTALLGALATLSKEKGKSATLLIRPHPRESGDIYCGLAHDSVRILVSGAGGSRDLALSADLVVGINTMFLVEARHLGCPALSIRLSFPLPDDFPPNRSGMIPAVYQEDDIIAALRYLLNTTLQELPLPEVPVNASRNVAQLVYSMLKD